MYAATPEALKALGEKYGDARRDGETVRTYLDRLQAAGHLLVIDREAARDPRSYREIVAQADQKRLPVFIHDPAPPTLDPKSGVRLSRTAARDPQQYREARRRADSLGVDLVLVDE